MTMRVSALICVRDGEAHLAEAIESALAQTVPPLELIVAEDGSTDRSADVARSYEPRVRLVRGPAKGVGAARNRAVAAASGELIAFLDCDDLWEPDKLERQLAAFEGDPGLDFTFTHMTEFANPGEEDRYTARPGRLPAVIASGLCARRDAIERAGGFDEDVAVGDIAAWLVRARELGMREETLPDVLVRRRVHANNMTRRLRSDFGDYARVLKASLDRRRRAE
jgi:glycosyltransferase involved in cell wall biosynthesis